MIKEKNSLSCRQMLSLVGNGSLAFTLPFAFSKNLYANSALKVSAFALAENI